MASTAHTNNVEQELNQATQQKWGWYKQLRRNPGFALHIKRAKHFLIFKCIFFDFLALLLNTKPK